MQSPEECAALLERCLASDEGAWYALHAQYDRRLRACIRKRLGCQTGRRFVVEEIAARVWASLWPGDRRRLRAYDPGRGNFAPYLAGLAKDEVRRFYRQQ